MNDGVVDRLVVKVTLDTQGLKQSAQQVDSTIKDLSKSISSTLTSALSIFGVAFSAEYAKKFITATNNMVLNTGNLADQLGVGVTKLSGFQNMIKSVGGSVDDFNSSMKGLVNNLGMASLGQNPQFMGVMQALGINMKDAHGNIKNPLDLRLEQIQKLRSSSYNLYQKQGLANMLGFDSGSMNLLFDKKANGQYEYSMSDIRKRIDKMGNVTNPEVEQARQTQEEWTTTTAAWSKMTVSWVSVITPALNKLASALNYVLGDQGQKDTAQQLGITPEQLKQYNQGSGLNSHKIGTLWTQLKSSFGFEDKQKESVAKQSLQNIMNADSNNPLLKGIAQQESMGGKILDPHNGAYGLYGARISYAKGAMKLAGWSDAQLAQITPANLIKDKNLDLIIAKTMLSQDYKTNHGNVGNTIDMYGTGIGSGYHSQVYSHIPNAAQASSNISTVNNNSNSTHNQNMHIGNMTVQSSHPEAWYNQMQQQYMQNGMTCKNFSGYLLA